MTGRQQRWLALLPFAMLALTMAACGGFQARGTQPTATATRPRATETPVPSATVPATVQPLAAATPTPAGSPTAAGGGGLAAGAKARVAVDAINVRSEAKASGAKVGALTNGTVVTVRGGPVNADNFTWYQVDNGAGLTGWVAAGPADAPWLVPAGGTAAPAGSGPHLVNRQIKVGDLVQVTTGENQILTIRASAAKAAEAVARVKPGTNFTVKGGPTQQDGLTWWQVEGEQVKGWAAEGDGQNRWLTPVEQ